VARLRSARRTATASGASTSGGASSRRRSGSEAGSAKLMGNASCQIGSRRGTSQPRVCQSRLIYLRGLRHNSRGRTSRRRESANKPRRGRAPIVSAPVDADGRADAGVSPVMWFNYRWNARLCASRREQTSIHPSQVHTVSSGRGQVGGFDRAAVVAHRHRREDAAIGSPFGHREIGFQSSDSPKSEFVRRPGSAEN
jgi:hypothetical protein